MSFAARVAAFGGACLGASSPRTSRSRRIARVCAVGRVAPTTASFRRMSRFRLHAEDKPWWDDAPLPSRMKNAAREIEFFGGSPLQRVLPWMSKPKATPPGRPDPKDPDALILFDFTDASSDADVDRFQRVWGELNDVVMGGSSEAFATVITIPEDEGGKCVKLSGVVEGENGGFCSMRTRDFVTPWTSKGTRAFASASAATGEDTSSSSATRTISSPSRGTPPSTPSRDVGWTSIFLSRTSSPCFARKPCVRARPTTAT